MEETGGDGSERKEDAPVGEDPYEVSQLFWELQVRTLYHLLDFCQG